MKFKVRGQNGNSSLSNVRHNEAIIIMAALKAYSENASVVEWDKMIAKHMYEQMQMELL